MRASTSAEARLETGASDGRYRVQPHITFHAVIIGENADNPEWVSYIHVMSP